MIDVNGERMYTTREVMDLFNIRSRQTLYARGWTDRAVRMFGDDTAPLIWPQSVVDEFAAELGVTL